MNIILSSLEYWLVKHPIIVKFEWIQGQTFGSTPLFLILTIFSYLSITFLLSHMPLPSIAPHFLKRISTVHNFVLLLLSFIMAVGCTLASLYSLPQLLWIICLPPHTPPTGPVFFWAYVFYLSKILEFVDTLLIILSGSFQRLTFLHMYHHSMVLIMCYLWLHASQSLISVGVVTNATVHVIMYGYYFFCSLGIQPKWKRLVTDFQILQFVFGFVVSYWMLYEHFTGSIGGCSGIRSWYFNILFNASLLALFVNFHFKSYSPNTNTKNKMDRKL